MPKRKAAAASDLATATVLNKFRSALDDAANEFVCGITQELPVDPVTAQDGHIYERAAIEE